MGNCGVTFAPCRPEDREYLAELMESVEDIPARRDHERPAVGLGHVRRVPGHDRSPAEGTERRRDGRSLRAAPVRDGRSRPRPGRADRRRPGDDVRPARRGDARRRARVQHEPDVPAQGARRSARAGHLRAGRGAVRAGRCARPPPRRRVRVGEPHRRGRAQRPRRPADACRAGMDGRGQPAQRAPGQLRAHPARQPAGPLPAGDRLRQGGERIGGDGPAADDGAQRRRAVQPRHAAACSTAPRRGASCTRCATARRWWRSATPRSGRG